MFVMSAARLVWLSFLTDATLIDRGEPDRSSRHKGEFSWIFNPDGGKEGPTPLVPGPKSIESRVRDGFLRRTGRFGGR